MATTHPAVGLLLLLALLSPSLVLSQDENGKPIKNPPGSTGCPDFPATGVPANNADGPALAAAGWVPGKLYKYYQGNAEIWLGVYDRITAGTCYNIAVCKQGLDIAYVSWISRTNSGTKGNCHVFQGNTCNPRYPPGYNPFTPGVKDWYTTAVDKDNMDACEEFCGKRPDLC